MLRRISGLSLILFVGAMQAGCAKPKPPVEKHQTYRVHTPWANVDVDVPEEHKKDVKVDVNVKP